MIACVCVVLPQDFAFSDPLTKIGITFFAQGGQIFSSKFYQTINGDNKTILKNLEQFQSSHTKLKPKLPHILNFANILEGQMKRQTKITASTKH